MTKFFREKHLIILLEKFSVQNLPLDVFIRNYFKQHKAIGSHDRRFLAETIYSLIRWLGLVDHLCGKDHSWTHRYDVFTTLNFDEVSNLNLPSHIRVSFPKKLYDLFVGAFGAEQAEELCLICNTPAPTTVRINPLKIDRETLLSNWHGRYEVSQTSNSPLGVIFHKRENFFGMDEFKQGYFEVQDEGSQLIAFLVQAAPGQQVLDFCSGSGGKTLGFAPFLEGKGQIYLHDKRDFVLSEAKKRLNRAGVQNAQFVLFNDNRKKTLKGKMDWVLVDGPCSGTGTLRRNPDMKWRFNPDNLPQLIAEQRQIFSEALSYVKPGGKIVYATCSILPQENMEQVNYFLREHLLNLVSTPLETFPSRGGMDGFFGAVLEKIKI